MRIRGDAVQKGPNKWGWVANIFIDGKSEMSLNDGGKFKPTKQEAIDHMHRHAADIQKIMNNGDFLENKPDGKPASKYKAVPNRLQHEDTIKTVHDAYFWKRVDAHARYDFKHKKLRDFFLDKKPEPNIILISGLEDKPADFDPNEAPHLLDLPFSTCVIEATDKTLFNLEGENIPAGGDDVQCLVIVELDGGYGFLARTWQGHHSWATDPRTDTYKLFMTVAKSLCTFINSKTVKIGQEKTNVRFKHKKTGLVKIKKLIHISNTVNGKPVTSNRFQVDWSHKWEVRGHWRSVGISKVGKDRNSNYCIKGFTWVKSHIKGPEDKNLTKKIRVKSNG